MPAQASPRQPPLAFGPFAFDPQSRILSRNGQELSIPPRVLGVLELLLQRAGEVVPRQELIDTVWKDAFVTDTSLAEAVSLLRQVLGDDSQSPTYVQTLHRRGYRFVAPVSPPPTLEGSDPALTAVSPSISRELLPWSVAAICAFIAIAAVWQYTRKTPEASPIAARFAIQLPAGWNFDDQAPSLALAPDGTVVAWSACDRGGCHIFTRALDQIEPQAVAGTEDGRAPFFSPDGRWLGFFANGRLSKVAISGGTAVTIADAPATLGAVWFDGEIIFAGSPTGGLMRVSADGGEPRPLTAPRETDGEVRHAWPARVPGTNVLLFTIDRTLATDAAALPGTLAAVSVGTANGPRASSWRTLLDNVNLARALGRDTIVFARESELHVVGFDAERLSLSGAPGTIRSQLATARGRAHFALADSGTLVHAAAPAQGNRTLVFFRAPSPAGAQAPQNLALREAAVSPDGRRVAGVNLEGPGAGIWISDSHRGNATRLVHKDINAAPVWSADGGSIFFASRSNGVFEIWRRSVDGTDPPVRVFGMDRHAFPLAASPDGKLLAFLQSAEATRADIWILPLEGGAPRLIVQTPFDEVAASFSPGSDFLAFQSAETGRWEVYVQRLADGRRVLVSNGGGERPFWTRDALYYQSGHAVVRKIITAEGDAIRIDDGLEKRVAIDHRSLLQGVAADGQLLLTRAADPPPSVAIVSLEWGREVRAILGPPASELPR